MLSLLPKDTRFKNTFDFTTVGEWDCVHFSVYFSFLSFGITYSFVKLSNVGSLRKPNWLKLAIYM